MESVTINGKEFVPYISNDKIMEAVKNVASKLNKDFEGVDTVPVMLCVLNGSIVFCGHLLPRLNFPLEIASIRLSSYQGTKSTGKMREMMGLDIDVTGRTVVIVEDIVDTGFTIESLVSRLKERGAADIRVCTFSLKRDVYKLDFPIDYVAMDLPEKFVVGWGLDYDQLGRNLNGIYVLAEQA